VTKQKVTHIDKKNIVYYNKNIKCVRTQYQIFLGKNRSYRTRKKKLKNLQFESLTYTKM